VENANLNAWLVRKSGLRAGARYAVRDETVRVGRSAENDVVISEAAMVSARHLEVSREGGAYRLRDLNSTNGTYLNGERVSEALLEPPCVIRLGADGPELSFVIDDAPPEDLNQTLVVSATSAVDVIAPDRDSADVGPSKAHQDLLSEAVERARMARRMGVGDSTVVIMREMLDAALHRTGRKFKAVIAVLVLALVGTSAYGFWKIQGLKKEKGQIDGEIQQIEAMLARANRESAETDQLIDRLDQYEDQALALQKKLLYRVGAFEHEESIKHEIRALMAEFGAETYSIPPEFLQQVNRFIGQYQGADRRHMERALGEARPDIDTMRQIFNQNNLPPDLAYIVLVESALSGGNTSSAGAAGLWQFTAATARAYGLKVGADVDERLDATKSTRAACKYIRELILDFGSGSSVMLALAAYNLGPAKVKAAVRKANDPIKQRNFWYLYRVRAVPPETREYVPKVIAAMIIGRHPDRYDF
jgi:pSer/pThr/pTyr-binding forkhead associated (FHA) protein/soluble lytic murein transglycosylase-like protein